MKCYSCDYERIIDEREFIEDIQQCPNCNSNKIEIITSEDSVPERRIDPSEWEQIVRRRMAIVGGIGTILTSVGIVLLMMTRGLFPPAITFLAIGVIFLVISIGWSTDGNCFAC